MVGPTGGRKFSADSKSVLISFNDPLVYFWSFIGSKESQMAFKVLVKRFKALKTKGGLVKVIRNKTETQRIWTGVSHGFHTGEMDNKANTVSVHAQREQVEGQEFWLFGAYDQQLSRGVTDYLQSNLFDNNLTEYQIRRIAKDTMKKAHVSAKAEANDTMISGSATVLVMNGERFVAASVGGYRAVLCRDGVATQLGTKPQQRAKRKWSVSDMWNMKCASINSEDNPRRISRIAVASRKVGTETEFIILASDGVWEVMRNQEAVDLVGHIGDAQEAAECLAKEAINRMSKSTVSCVVIRFH